MSKADIAKKAIYVEREFRWLQHKIDSYADKPLTEHRHGCLTRRVKYLKQNVMELITLIGEEERDGQT
jgi:hypothetical protein